MVFLVLVLLVLVLVLVLILVLVFIFILVLVLVPYCAMSWSGGGSTGKVVGMLVIALTAIWGKGKGSGARTENKRRRTTYNMGVAFQSCLVPGERTKKEELVAALVSIFSSISTIYSVQPCEVGQKTTKTYPPPTCPFESLTRTGRDFCG